MSFAWHDLLWLLLPLAAASGWFMARRDQWRERSRTANGWSSEYFRGINFLLNEQPDKAIEVFTQMAEVNSDTVDTHLALGGLFRRRGEVERAIRIHQNLVARPALEVSQRALALCELALDYQRAGLLDRAENLFLELAEIPEHAEQALRSLMHIYEQEKEWDKALHAGRRIMKRFGRPLGPVLAQYRCEMAERKVQEGEPEEGTSLLRDALKLDAGCARASLLLGRIAAAGGRHREAISVWQKIEDQDPRVLDEIADELAAAYRATHDDAGMYRSLEKLAASHPSPRLLKTLVQLIESREGRGAALAFVRERVRRHPSLHGLRQWLDLLNQEESTASSGDIDRLREVLDRMVVQEGAFVCGHCGFQAQARHWQCPACHGWLTVNPVIPCYERRATAPPDRIRYSGPSFDRRIHKQ